MNLKSVERIIWEKPFIPATRPVTDDIFEFAEDTVLRMQVKSGGKYYKYEQGVPQTYLNDKCTRWPLRKRDGLCEAGGLFHDPNYETKGYRRFVQEGLYLLIDGEPSTMDRRAADDLYELMFDRVKENSTEQERDKAWLRIGGWIYWGRTKKAIKKIRKERNKK